MKICSVFCLLIVSLVASAQQIDIVDYQRISAAIGFVKPGEVSGDMTVEFRILKDTDTIYLDAVGVEVVNLTLKNLSEDAEKQLNFQIEPNKLIFLHDFIQNNDYVLQLSYTVKPIKALYFVENQIWTQGQGKYTSHWLPSIDDVNDKIEFDLAITFKNNYEVLANGKLLKKELLAGNVTKWYYDMEAPMSSYLVALTIGNYDKTTEMSASGIPLEYYYYPKDSSKTEATYRYSKQMFDFLEQEIGVPFPWEIYKQVPVRDFLYSGMENTTLTIFSDALVVDAVGFNDRNYVNVNAHELAHQWFGDYVTATSSTHHWLQEGFATYYALLAERDVFGEAYYYWRLHEYSQQLLKQDHDGASTSLLDPTSSSITFYQKGAWALHVLREYVGDEAFRLAVKNYIMAHQFQNVATDDFLSKVEEASGQDLTEFVNVWLEAVALPQDAMVKSLKNSEFIREYLDVSCETYPAKCPDYLVSDISDKAKVKLISQESYSVKLEDFNNNLEVRQAIAQKMSTIPQEYKKAYESLLQDKSYTTIETSLYNLWVNFPEERAKYLQQTKDIYGFSDYNVKLLWLALHLNTVEYQPDRKVAAFEELRGYTHPQFGFELRMNAFSYLKLINGFDQATLSHLIKATNHHNWRFQKFSKQLLQEIEALDGYREIINKIRGIE